MSDQLKVALGITILLVTFVCYVRCHSPGPASATEHAVAASGPATISAVQDGSELRISGVLPDETTRSTVLAAAQALHRGSTVVDAVRIDPDVEACSWLTTRAWRAALLPGIERSTLDCSALTLEGSVASDATRSKLGAAALTALGGSVTLTNRLTITAPAVDRQIAQVLELRNIEFDSGRATITANGMATLREILAALAAAPGTRFVVAGHTDDRGDPQANISLSQARANAVVSYLTREGLGTSRFDARGYGASRPIADNSTAEGRRRNRRIEFVKVGG
ncbi:MAG: OmpA family protein [Proteobacteria bacterium]|nr:OmpA family protein [Pseudomonadota bacterium]